MHVAKCQKPTVPTPQTMRVHLVIVEATESYNEDYIHYTEGSSARIETHLDNESHLIIKHSPPPPRGQWKLITILHKKISTAHISKNPPSYSYHPVCKSSKILCKFPIRVCEVQEKLACTPRSSVAPWT